MWRSRMSAVKQWGSLGRARKWVVLENQSMVMMVRMVFPLGWGKTSDEGQGHVSPRTAGYRQGMEQAVTGWRTLFWLSASMVAHQNRCRRKSRVWVVHGWQTSGVECAHKSSLYLR